MALTQEQLDRILGKQSVVDRVLSTNKSNVSSYDPSWYEKKRHDAQMYLESQGVDRNHARNLTENILGSDTKMGAMEFNPFYGLPKAGEYLGREYGAPALKSFSEGNIASGLGNLGGAGIGIALSTGKVPTPVKTAVKGAAKKATQAIGTIFDNASDYEKALKMAQDKLHLKRDATGHYVGAPENIDTPQKLTKLRNETDEVSKFGLPIGGDWYDKTRLAYQDATGYDPLIHGYGTTSPEGSMASLFSRGGAVYSPQATPSVETAHFLKQHNAKVLTGENIIPRQKTQAENLSNAYVYNPETGGYTFKPENVKLGNKTGNYANDKDPTVDLNKNFLSTNDLWQGRLYGYAGKNGKAFNRGFTPQEHNWQWGENLLAADRLNNQGVTAGALELPVTPSRLQAGGWVGQRFATEKSKQDLALNKYNTALAKFEKSGKGKKPTAPTMKSDEELWAYANASPADALPRHLANDTYEYVTGANVGHLKGLNELPADVRDKYTNELAALYGSRDPYYEAMQLYQAPQIGTQGKYLNSNGVYEYNSGVTARPYVDLVNSNLGVTAKGKPRMGGAQMSDISKNALDTGTQLRTIFNANEAGANNKFTAANSSMKTNEKNGVRIESDPESLKKLDELLGQQGLDVINVGDGIHVTSFKGWDDKLNQPTSPQFTPQQIQKLTKDAIKKSGINVGSSESGRLESGYFGIPWANEGVIAPEGTVTQHLQNVLDNSKVFNLKERLDSSRLPSLLSEHNTIDQRTASELGLPERQDIYKLRTLLSDPAIGFKGINDYIKKYGYTGLPAAGAFSVSQPDDPTSGSFSLLRPY